MTADRLGDVDDLVDGRRDLAVVDLIATSPVYMMRKSGDCASVFFASGDAVLALVWRRRRRLSDGDLGLRHRRRRRVASIDLRLRSVGAALPTLGAAAAGIAEAPHPVAATTRASMGNRRFVFTPGKRARSGTLQSGQQEVASGPTQGLAVPVDATVNDFTAIHRA